MYMLNLVVLFTQSQTDVRQPLSKVLRFQYLAFGLMPSEVWRNALTQFWSTS